MSCQDCTDPHSSCTITRQQLEKSNVFAGGLCPECSHNYGKHADPLQQPITGRYIPNDLFIFCERYDY